MGSHFGVGFCHVQASCRAYGQPSVLHQANLRGMVYPEFEKSSETSPSQMILGRVA